MAITPSQLSSILRVKKEFNLISGNITLTDLTNWSGENIIAPDTAAVLLKLVAPTGVDVYINAGYDTDDFSAPDFDLTTDTLSETMPTDVNGDYVTGTYTLYMKAKVVDINGNGDIVTVTTQNPSVGNPQIDVSTISGTLVDGDTVSVEYSSVEISYTIQSGDTTADAAQGLFDAIALYQTNNPASDWANDLFVVHVGGSSTIEFDSNYLNTPFTLTSEYTHANSTAVTTASAVESTAEVCNCTTTVTIDIDVDYATAVLTSTDTTSYGAYSSISRTHTIYPPPISGLPNQTTSATTNVYSNIVTTTWSVKITSNVTYLKANDTYTTCQLIGTKEVVVEADTLCATLCLIKKFRTDFYAKYGKKCVDDMEKAYNLAMDEFFLAWMATRCGRPQSEIQAYINKIYDITGIDPDCDCGCSASDYPTPVVPTSIINGTDGTDGVTPEFQNTGTWIQVSIDGGNTWTNLFSLASVTGAAGAAGTNGTDGSDGVAVLTNQYPALATLGTAFETLNANAAGTARTAWSLPLNTLNTNEDEIEIYAAFTGASSTSAPNVRLTFNGSALNVGYNTGFSAQISKITIFARLSRTSNTTAKYELITKFYAPNVLGIPAIISQGEVHQDVTSLAGLNFTTTAYDIAAQADSVVIGDVTLQAFEITYKHKV